MAKLITHAQVEEGLPDEELAIPLLKGGSSVMWKWNGGNLVHLNSVERVASMLVNNTLFTR